MLTAKLKPAIRSKPRGLLSKGVVLLHDNARQHTAAHTAETLRKLKSEVLDHPTNSPDLAPSDHYLFDPFKEALKGRRFTTNEALKEAVQSGLHLNQKHFFMRVSGTLNNNGPIALKSKETMSKIDVLCMLAWSFTRTLCQKTTDDSMLTLNQMASCSDMEGFLTKKPVDD
ncbi:hypothetical protein LSTR_LSTR011519 [Laodelphax striatellus]|uniref:Histone-lysine N-methyltransferase SETMAR n=1 Tax=Laodelphax striatellus TaxID=195883 RepID=A0A482WF33_LAOST|nr:hypothetical protein LSTR_LSTR011519 [Laodelphax striatellus]